MPINRIKITDIEKTKPDELIGNQFEISGVLFIDSNDHAWIACDKTIEIKDQFNILIEQNSLLDNILERIPVYIGGKYLYRDEAVIIGTIRAIEQRLTLTKVIDLRVKRDGQEYHFAKGACTQTSFECFQLEARASLLDESTSVIENS